MDEMDCFIELKLRRLDKSSGKDWDHKAEVMCFGVTQVREVLEEALVELRRVTQNKKEITK